MKCIYFTCVYLLFSLFVSAQWTDDVAQNLQVAGVNAADIQSVGITGGKTWIAFYSQHGGNYDMRAQLLDSTGKKLLGDSGVLVSNKKSGSATYVFNVCVNGKGELIIGYQYEINGVLNAVLSKVNQDGKLLWGEGGVVIGPGLSPYPAALSTSETAVAWSNSKTNTLGLQIVSYDGSIKSDSVVSVKVESATTTRGQVIANLNGNFTLVFQRNNFVVYTTLYALHYDHNRKALWSAPVQLCDQTTSAARYYSLAAEQDTTYVGYYSSEGSRFNAFVQRINPDSVNTLPYGMNGSHFSTDTAVTDNYQQTINIGEHDSSSVLWAVCTYSDFNQVNYGVYAQKFDKITGARLLSDKAKQVLAVSAEGDMQEGNLQLTGNERAGFIFIDNKNHIYATKLDNKGNIDSTVGTVLLASTGNAKSRINFAANDVIAVAVWSEDRGNGELPFAQNITATGVTGVLPVVISDFKVEKNGKKASLSWHTLTETNNNGFYIERSEDGRSFSSIGFANSKADANHSTDIAYTYIDKLPLAKNNYYRLQQVDNIGHVTYSATVMVTFDDVASFVVSRLYPNPARNLIYVEIESNIDNKAIAVITAANGKIIKQQNVAITAGSNLLPVTIQALSPGTYFITVTTSDNSKKTMKFTKL